MLQKIKKYATNIFITNTLLLQLGRIWGRACGKKMGEELLMGLLYLLQTSEEGDGVV